MKNEITCLTCTNLDNCRLKPIILNPSIEKCNYAAEGCVYYHGELRGTDKDKVLHILSDKKMITFGELSEKTGLPIATKRQRQIIWNAVNRLIREGVQD